MKKILKLAMFFITLVFALVLSLVSEPNVICSQELINSTGSLQSLTNESVVLISSNNLNEEISSRQKKNDNGFTGELSYVVPNKQVNNISDMTTLHFCGEYVHNLSNSAQNTHNIRAP